jgi:hypothetical protein
MPTSQALIGGISQQPLPLQPTQSDKNNPNTVGQYMSTQASQPHYAWRNTISTIPTSQIINQLNYAQMYGGEALPVLVPRLASATPIISGAFAGYTAYDSFRREYNDTKDLPPKTRYQKLAAKLGDLTLFHLFASLIIPGLMAKKVNQWVNNILKKPHVPPFIARHPKWVTAAALFLTAAVISKPVNKTVNFILDWTYRPLVEKRKREKWLKLYNAAYHARMDEKRRTMQAEHALPPPVEEAKALEKVG